MRPPCEVVIKYLLPAFRSAIARSLTAEYGFTQLRAAKSLGTTQAAVSYYLGERRGRRIRTLEENEMVRSAARDVAQGLATGGLTSGEATAKFCQLCSKLRSSNLFCDLHRDIENVNEQCSVCVVPGCS